MTHLEIRKPGSRPEDARAADRSSKPESCAIVHSLSALVIIGIIFLTGLPSWAHDFYLETGNGRIKGHARQAKLGQVLSQLAQRSGYKVYIDEKLVTEPVTFDLPVALDAEKAIRRIVHPFSYALVFSRLPETGDLRIDQVKVFSKGSQSSNYMLLTGDGSGPVISSSYARGYRSAGTQKGVVRAGKAAVDHHVKPMLEITKSSMGFTGYRFRDQRRGPDDTLDTRKMAKAYADYRKERQALEDRSSKATLRDAHKKAEQEKQKYRTQRTASIQQTLDASQVR